MQRGKGFKKEKIKIKNKTFHEGMNISTAIRFNILENDSLTDEK